MTVKQKEGSVFNIFALQVSKSVFTASLRFVYGLCYDIKYKNETTEDVGDSLLRLYRHSLVTNSSNYSESELDTSSSCRATAKRFYC